MQGIRVFISYSRKDRDIARDIALELMERGIIFFLDTMHIQPGEHWDKAIHLALYRSTHLLLVHTRNSFESDNVWDEWSYFRGRNKAIIPLVFDDTELPFRLERVQHIDFATTSPEDALRNLLSNLRPVELPQLPQSGLFGTQDLDDTAPAPATKIIHDDRDNAAFSSV